MKDAARPFMSENRFAGEAVHLKLAMPAGETSLLSRSSRRLAAFALFLLCALPLSSCSYLKKRVLQSRIRGLQDSRAENLSFTPPPPPYKEEPSENLDRLWRSAADQSSISYFSSCGGDNRSLSLKEIRQAALSDLPGRRILSESVSEQGLRAHFEAESGGLTSLNSLFAFKRKTCFFILNFVAGDERIFKKNKPLFDNFIKNFKAF